MPFGYLVTTVLLAAATTVALAPPRPRHSDRSNLAFRLGFLVNELPFVAGLLLVASTLLALGQGDLDTPVGWVAFGVAVVTTVGLVVIAWRGSRAGTVVDAALREGLGPGWRTAVEPGLSARLRRRLPLLRILVWPFPVRRGVQRVANLRYGDAGRQNLLDVYRHRSRPTGGPTLVYFHGGGFVGGRKNREARPLLHRLARQGWVCVSANYRLGPAARFPDHHVDAKKVLAWVREHGHEYGADPQTLVVAGSSAGAHLASLTALTPNMPALQPGFEGADTSVSAAVCLYGYYGPLDADGGPPSSPLEHVGPDAPPFFLAHGDQDTTVLVDDARAFVERLRSRSSGTVVYAELPGAQHAFDIVHSLRSEAVVDGVEAFTAWVRSRAVPWEAGAQPDPQDGSRHPGR